MTNENSILVGIPDVVVGRSLTNTQKEPSNIAVAAPPTKPITVNVPILEEVREGYLEVREVGTGEIITVIEILSPKNKRTGKGRKAYESKRQQVLGSFTHVVEIHLLRGGEPMPILGNQMKSDYRILGSRSESRPKAELYPFGLQEQIPAFLLPIRQGDTEPLVDLQILLHSVYDAYGGLRQRAGFDLAIDYTPKAVPPLGEVDAAWVYELLKEQGLH